MTCAHLPSPGLGTASLALVPENIARATLDRALDVGLRYFDTAALYGGGMAEERLGHALCDAPDDVIVSTKCGRTREYGAAAPGQNGVPDVWDFSERAIHESIARSCERLRRERLDVVFLHDLEAAPDQALNEALPVLRDLQSKGQIGSVGAGCNTVAGLMRALEGGADDCLMVAGRWTLLDRSAGKMLLSRAAETGSRVVAAGVLNSGLLVDPDAPDAQFNYRRASEVERAAARRLAAQAAQAGVSLLAAALQFPSRDTRVATTILGAANPVELDAAVDAMRVKIPPSFWDAVANPGLGA